MRCSEQIGGGCCRRGWKRQGMAAVPERQTVSKSRNRVKQYLTWVSKSFDLGKQIQDLLTQVKQ